MYEFKEDVILKDIEEYIASTYDEHYANSGKIQTTAYIMSQFEDGIDFLRGNGLKYLSRYGIKAGRNQKDLLKTIHYCILMLYYDHYKESENSSDNQNIKAG